MRRNIQFTSYYQFSSLQTKKTEFTLISGDLCLLCDLPSESWSHYETAMEILRSCNDWIWLAGNLNFFGFSPKLTPKSKMVDIVTGRNHNSKGEIQLQMGPCLGWYFFPLYNCLLNQISCQILEISRLFLQICVQIQAFQSKETPSSLGI